MWNDVLIEDHYNCLSDSLSFFQLFLPWPPLANGARKKVRAEKSSNRRKSRTFFRSNFFPPNFFWFIWNQRCYNNGRPLILKLVPNHEEWDDKLAWFSWKWQRKSMLKWNVTVLCFLYKLIKAHKLGLSCAQLSRSCSRTFFLLKFNIEVLQ